MKPKKVPSPDAKSTRSARREPSAPPSEPTPSSRPELENDDSEAVPPDAGSAEAEEDKLRQRAADDGMPEDDV